MRRHRILLTDDDELLVKHAYEGQQILALVREGAAHRANAMGTERFQGCEFVQDTIKEAPACRQIGTSERQDVIVQPVGKDSDILAQSEKFLLSRPGKRQCSREGIATAFFLARAIFRSNCCRMAVHPSARRSQKPASRSTA